jgi:hypothetical protein
VTKSPLRTFLVLWYLMICAVESTKVEAVSQFLLDRPAASFLRNVGLPLDFHFMRVDLKGIGDALLSI